MNVMKRLAAFFLGLLTVTVSAIVFFETLEMRSLTGWFNQLRDDPAYHAVIWCMSGALLVFGLVVLVKSLTARGPEPALLLVMGNGSIAITEKAIQAHIMKTVLLTDEVRSPVVHIRINNRNSFIEAEIAFSVFNQVDLPGLCRKIQSEVTTTVENFTETPLKNVCITVQDLRTRDRLKVV
jgi:uncharacterized alkaline shock family protein YloU